MSSIYNDVYKDCGFESSLDEWFSLKEEDKIAPIKGKKYNNQIVALYSKVPVFWDYVIENSGIDYIKQNYIELLEKHSKEIEDNFDSLSKYPMVAVPAILVSHKWKAVGAVVYWGVFSGLVLPLCLHPSHALAYLILLLILLHSKKGS